MPLRIGLAEKQMSCDIIPYCTMLYFIFVYHTIILDDCVYMFGGFFVGVLIVRALLFGVYIRCP